MDWQLADIIDSRHPIQKDRFLQLSSYKLGLAVKKIVNWGVKLVDDLVLNPGFSSG